MAGSTTTSASSLSASSARTASGSTIILKTRAVPVLRAFHRSANHSARSRSSVHDMPRRRPQVEPR